MHKNVFEKGAPIAGRIDFECLSELREELAKKFGTRAHTIKIHGVFKTIVQ